LRRNIMNFSDRLAKAIKEKNNPTVLGLDPKLEFIPDSIKKACFKDCDCSFKAAAKSIVEFNIGLMDATYDIIPAIKPQVAYYEMLGPEGISAFNQTIQYAKQRGFVVIADGKRNDIGPTAEAYSCAFLGKTSLLDTRRDVFNADALTVNAYLGIDGIKPFLNDCTQEEKGIFILVKTSNPSSGQFQDLKLEDGRRIYEMVADLVNEWGEPLIGNSGYSSVGAVVGATYPDQLKALRERMPKTWILVPGYGAQGGGSKDVAAAFDKNGLGAIVNASRSLMCAHKLDFWKDRYSCEDFREAARAEAIRMRDDILSAI
jgi:orotidine-5'-phosphate decarboxylase